MNAWLRGRDGTSGVDWSKATEIGYALLLSPLFGFMLAAVLLLVPRHSDYDWLILSQSRMGKSSGATRIWMLLATPG